MAVAKNNLILASDCVSTATANTLVLRDSNADFASRYITINKISLLNDNNVDNNIQIKGDSGILSQIDTSTSQNYLNINAITYINNNAVINGNLYLSLSKHLYMSYNNASWNVLNNHANGNLSVNALGLGLYLGYWNTNQMHFYYSTETNGTVSRTEYLTINSNGAYAPTRFGVNGQDTGHTFYVNGNAVISSYLETGGYVNILNGASLYLTGSGAIVYRGTKLNNIMIDFIDNTAAADGNGIVIGGGGQTVIGGGESARTIKAQLSGNGSEVMYIGNDTDVNIFTNLQNGWASRKIFTFTSSGALTLPVAGTSWLDGQKWGPLNLSNATNTSSYWPWIRQTNTSSSKYFSIGVLNNSLYVLGSASSRTENGYDYCWYFNVANGYLYGNFSGNLSGTATKATQDGNGATISSTYAKLTGATFSGAVAATTLMSSQGTGEKQVGVNGTAGTLYLYSATSSTGNRGIWAGAHGTATSGKTLLYVDTNNQLYYSTGIFYGALITQAGFRAITTSPGAGQTAATGSAIEVREVSYAGTAQSAWGYAPKIGFHWNGRAACQIGMDSAQTFHFFVNSSSTSYITVHAAAFTTHSSRKSKHDIQPIKDPSNYFDKLQPVSFVYNGDLNKKVQLGLIYEDTVNLCPEVCYLDGVGNKSINYSGLVPVLIKEIQNLRERVKNLENSK